MTVYGIVCECNPFHRGHQLIINRAYELGADAVVGVMSGNFVQRGEPAIISKFVRAEQMVRSGFDLVIELPVRFVLSSAQRFATGAVNLLNNTGAADVLLFGSESGALETLAEIASFLNGKESQEAIRMLQEKGMSYPAARETVCRNELGSKADCLTGGNDQLGIEYLKALNNCQSRMEPKVILREKDGFEAHAVRSLLEQGKSASALLPAGTDEDYMFGNRIDMKIFERSVLMKLREMSQEDFSCLEDISGGLDMRLYRSSRAAASMEELLSDVKTKRYTMSRIKRVILCAALGLRSSSDIEPPYARILAIGKKGKEVLSRMKENSEIPFGENLRNLSGTSPFAEIYAEEERRATDFYNLNLAHPLPVGQDFTHKLYVVQ